MTMVKVDFYLTRILYHRGKSGKAKGQKLVVFDSDDERAYENERVPDPSSSEFYHDAIDDFHSNKDKVRRN